MAASLGTVKEEEKNGRQFLVLHSFLELVSNQGPFDRFVFPGSPRVTKYFLVLIKENVPEQFCMYDDAGSLPIHIAVRNKKAAELGRRKCTRDCLDVILSVYPDSAGIPDQQGQLPLHSAITNGLANLQMLVDAEPRALAMRCAVTRMYPFQLAAVALSAARPSRKEQQVREAVNRTYMFLRACPQTIQAPNAVSKPWMDLPIYKEIQLHKLKIAQHASSIVQLERALESGKELAGGTKVCLLRVS